MPGIFIFLPNRLQIHGLHRSQAPLHASDYTWKSSQEIIFRTPSSSRTRRSSRGIVLSGVNPSPIPTRAPSHDHRRQRSLSTFLTRQISRIPTVSKTGVSRNLPLTSGSWNSSLASLGSNHTRATTSRAQTINSLSLLNNAHVSHGLPQSRTSILPGRKQNAHLATRLYWSDRHKAMAQNSLAKGQLYWDQDLSDDSRPVQLVIKGYIELLEMIDGLLRHKDLCLFPNIRLRLCDSYNDISFIKEDMIYCTSSYRGVLSLKEFSDQVRNQHGDGRIQKQRILAFELYSHRVLEPARLIRKSQPMFFHYGQQLIDTKRRRNMEPSKRLRRIAKLCMTTVIPPESFRCYSDLLIARYLYCNGGKKHAHAWLSAQCVLNNMWALFRDMKKLLYFWARKAREARTSSVIMYGCQDERWRYEKARMTFRQIYLGLKQSQMQLQRDLFMYQNTMIGRWADSSPDESAIAIYGVEWAKSHGPLDNKIQDAGKGITQAKSYDCSTDMSKPLELSQSPAVPHSLLSDQIMRLSIQPTKKMTQQQVSSSTSPALSVPYDFLSTRHEIMGASTKHTVLTTNEQCFNNMVEDDGTVRGTLQAHVPVENNKKPSQHYLSPLGYHIPEKQLADAKLACPSTRASYWQYLLYRGLNGEKVKVHYCKSKATTERIAQLFLNQEVLGFDIEWKPQALATEGVKKNVALIQIASEERIALFHIARYWEDEKSDDLLAPTLKEIMESPKITKVGVSIKADCTRLRKFMGIHSRGLFELSHLYKLVKFCSEDVKLINKKLVSLSHQVEEHLQLPLWKGEVRSSDWSQELDYEQIYCKYIADYARMFFKLKIRKTLRPIHMLDSSSTMFLRVNGKRSTHRPHGPPMRN